MIFLAPSRNAAKFTCPHCHAIARQEWYEQAFDGKCYALGISRHTPPNRVGVSHCDHCDEYTLWVDEQMVYPDAINVPPANTEMPEDVKSLYNEAATVLQKSPRASAALLRLAVQILCNSLGDPTKSINDNIKSFVKGGLPVPVQESLDVVRVTGNDAVHPGRIDTDDPEVVIAIFGLLNIIVEYMIAMPKKTSGLFKGLPQKAQDAIARRDTP